MRFFLSQDPYIVFAGVPAGSPAYFHVPKRIPLGFKR